MTILIVGAGLSGCVLAERYASIGKKVLVIEKRNHIAGNCYDYVDENGILICKYGAHIFHTNSEKVWNYINKFCKWIEWKHKVYGTYKNKYFPIPINLTTIEIITEQKFENEDDIKNYINSTNTNNIPITSEDVGITRFGKQIYESVIEGYTLKQWEKHPRELDASVVSRIPIYYNRQEGYFTDKYQALPEKGYTEFCKNMLLNSNIEIKLNTEFTGGEYEKIFYTGPIDQYFSNYGLPKLEYRSLRFEKENLNIEYFQQNSVINYTSKDIPYTRIIEYKHFLNQIAPTTTIVKEYPSAEGEPYYPVPNKQNLELFEKYKKLASEEKNVYFVGRLANYKYFNMDEAILNALNMFESLS